MSRAYPPRIRGHLLIKATGDRVVLVARRSGYERQEDGSRLMVYQTKTEGGGDLPVTNRDFLQGKVAVEFDMVPGMSQMQFKFQREESVE